MSDEGTEHGRIWNEGYDVAMRNKQPQIDVQATRIGDLERALFAANAEVRRLRVALHRYGKHDYVCDMQPGEFTDCICGLWDVRGPRQSPWATDSGPE
jgi:hypothetical protein